MNAASLSAAGLSALLPLATAVWLVRRFRASAPLSPILAGGLVASGAALGAGTWFVEGVVFRWTELGVDSRAPSKLAALLTLVLFATPLEEAAKALAILPLALAKRLDGPARGVVLAGTAALGFAAADAALFVHEGPLGVVSLVRGLAGTPAHAFSAGVWGYAWGRDRARGTRLLPSAWLAAVGVRALYEHIVFGRGPGFLVIAVPLLFAMGFVALSTFRDIAPMSAERGLLPLPLPEPPSMQSMRRAFRGDDHPLLLRWIAFGALVNVGAVIAAVSLAVFLARRIGLDLAVADEADMRSTGPLVVIGVAVLGAFPISGYLVARASGVSGVLEPAFAAGVAIAAAVALLTVTAPQAVVFALAVAPVAFGLACAGAWFGLES